MNYGGIGVVIGHELMHAFDDKGKYRLLTGNWIGLNWIDQAYLYEFKLTAKSWCILNLQINL